MDAADQCLVDSTRILLFLALELIDQMPAFSFGKLPGHLLEVRAPLCEHLAITKSDRAHVPHRIYPSLLRTTWRWKSA